MAGLQRSAVSFRRQGSSGLVWDDKFISEELKKAAETAVEKEEDDQEVEVKDRVARTIPPIKTTDQSGSNRGGGRGFKSRDTEPPAIDPPSPRVSACGFCSVFAKSGNKNQRAKPSKRRAW